MTDPLSKAATHEASELPLDSNFVEQAEYLAEQLFEDLNATHPDEESIIRRLSAGGAKLLVGPRGCGKTTLMLKAYYSLLKDGDATALPIYVNFKLSLKLEPLYQNTPNATYWFRLWLTLKIFEGLHVAIEASDRYLLDEHTPSKKTIVSALNAIESGRIDAAKVSDLYTLQGLDKSINAILEENDLTRCVLLLDDAAHAFSPRQQEDFFEFFRQIKSREISPKAAIYPGITIHSPTFHVGHDAEHIDVWVKPGSVGYIEFMRSLAAKRFGGELPYSLATTPDAVEFLAYTSFGIPRSFLNMLRAIYHDPASAVTGGLDRRKLLDVAKQSRELAHNVYESLIYKLPAYREFVHAGREAYVAILEIIKDYNRGKPDEEQALEVGIRRPVHADLERVISFFQYAGILMPVGENSRGVRGVFELYMVHFGDLVTDNAIIGRRTKSITLFVKAFTAQTHQAWPRVTPDRLLPRSGRPDALRLSLPHCQNCGSERASEDAKFCQNCGAQLKTASLYDELTKQDISVLPLTKVMVSRIKAHSSIRTIKDILIDLDKTKLRNIPFIGR